MNKMIGYMIDFDIAIHFCLMLSIVTECIEDLR
jgi:hypothetical protein